jgi:hypothetical protein
MASDTANLWAEVHKHDRDGKALLEVLAEFALSVAKSGGTSMKSYAVQSLTAFIESKNIRRTKNAYVTYPGFTMCYVRYTQRHLQGEMRYQVLDLGNLEARTPGNGAFTRLLKYVHRKWPDVWVYVECVQTKRFVKKLKKLGFIEVGDGGFGLSCEESPSFYLPPRSRD